MQIVDPEFPMGLFFGRILSKLHENEENWTETGGGGLQYFTL